MDFLSRKLRAAAEPARTEDAQRIVHREIEISVEREWISVIARGQSEGDTPAAAGGEPEPERMLRRLPLTKRE
jgi:hypothetical protein